MAKSKAYKDGFATGKTWTDSYRPGGPWVMRRHHLDSDKFKAECEATVITNKAWLQGFDDARSEAAKGV